jgi:hypothetical protein
VGILELFVSKVDETMGLVPNHEFMRISKKALRFSSTRSGVGLSKTGFLACPIRMVGPS